MCVRVFVRAKKWPQNIKIDLFWTVFQRWETCWGNKNYRVEPGCPRAGTRLVIIKPPSQVRGAYCGTITYNNQYMYTVDCGEADSISVSKLGILSICQVMVYG